MKCQYDLYKKLTKRQLEIADCARRGFTDKEIASALDISVFTVKAHLKNVYEKMEVSGRTELAGLPDWYETEAYKALPEKYKRWKIENKTKLERLSFGLSIETNNKKVIDKVHKYERIKRIDVLDTINGKYTSHRWLLLRNISKVTSLFCYHKESGETKIRFKDMNLRAYEGNKEGTRLKMESLVDLQPSFIQIFKIYFPRPIKYNEIIKLYYRLNWPGEPLVYSGQEHSQSISLTRYHNRVSNLKFGILEKNKILFSKCSKLTIEYEEEILPKNRCVFFKAEEDDDFVPIHGQRYKGFFYEFNNPDGLAYRIYYRLAPICFQNIEKDF
jgi:DNA-binding CsgD family transcriptional regulator